jgi:hypothetical protein
MFIQWAKWKLWPKYIQRRYSNLLRAGNPHTDPNPHTASSPHRPRLQFDSVPQISELQTEWENLFRSAEHRSCMLPRLSRFLMNRMLHHKVRSAGGIVSLGRDVNFLFFSWRIGRKLNNVTQGGEGTSYKKLWEIPWSLYQSSELEKVPVLRPGCGFFPYQDLTSALGVHWMASPRLDEKEHPYRQSLPGADWDDINKKFWEELIAYFPLIRHGSHRKWRVQQFLYSCVWIRCRCNVFTEPLPSNDRGFHIQAFKLVGGIYEVGRWDGLRCHDIFAILSDYRRGLDWWIDLLTTYRS